MISGLNPVCVRGVEMALNVLVKLIEDDDVIITMGAGTIGSLPSAIVLASKQSQPEKSNRVEI